jgi:hypothetical protein
MHGKGRLVWADGTYYEGEFRDGLMSGWGRFCFKSLTGATDSSSGSDGHGGGAEGIVDSVTAMDDGASASSSAGGGRGGEGGAAVAAAQQLPFPVGQVSVSCWEGEWEAGDPVVLDL